MKSMRQKIEIRVFLVALLWAFTVPVSLSGLEAFDTANLAYEQGDYQAAREGYLELVADGKRSAHLFYNLGNAEYRLGNVGGAILNYRRALYLDPAFAEAAQNLALAARSADNPAAAMEVRPFWLAWISVNVLLGLLTFFFWLTVLAGIWIVIGRRGDRFRPVLVASGALTVILGVIFAMELRSQPGAHTANVLAPETALRSHPSDTAPALKSLPAGGIVEVISQPGQWTYVEVPEGERGYVRSVAVETFFPPSS